MPDDMGRTRGIASTTFFVALIFLATRAIGFVREPLVAALYGASASADSFYVALGIVNLVYAITLGGLVPSVIPVFMSKRRKEGEQRAWSFLGGFSFWLGLSLFLLGGIMLTWASGVVSLFAPGLTPEVHASTAQILRIVLVLPLLTALATTLSSALNGYGHFVLPASALLMGNAVSLALLLVLSPFVGVRAAAVGVATGVAAQALALGWGTWRCARPFAPSLSLRDTGLSTALRLGLPGMGSEALLSIWPFAIVFFGSSLAAGTYSSIQFGNKVQVIFLDVLIAAVSVVMYPRLVQAAHGGKAQLRELSAFTVRLMVMILVPVTAAVVTLRYPLIQLVYERRAFDTRATSQTAVALGLFALSLAPLGIKDAVMRTFYSMHDAITPIWGIVPAVVLDFALSAGLVHRFGAVGLLAAYSASSVVLAVALLWLLWRRGVNIVDVGFTLAVVKVVAATTAMTMVLTLVARTLPGLDVGAKAEVVIRVCHLMLAFGISGAVYLAALVALRHPEAIGGIESVRIRLRSWSRRRPGSAD